jgi:hypothetical protein
MMVSLLLMMIMMMMMRGWWWQSGARGYMMPSEGMGGAHSHNGHADPPFFCVIACLLAYVAARRAGTHALAQIRTFVCYKLNCWTALRARAVQY